MKPANEIRSRVASERHAEGSEPCAAASVLPASSSDDQSAAAHEGRSPLPQVSAPYGLCTGLPSTMRTVLSMYEYQPASYELPA